MGIKRVIVSPGDETITQDNLALVPYNGKWCGCSRLAGSFRIFFMTTSINAPPADSILVSPKKPNKSGGEGN